MLSTTSEFSYGMSVNMSDTLRVNGLASVAASATLRFVIAPDRWTSG